MLDRSLKRIVIIGSAGVGKTTLLEGLKKYIKLKTIPEQARVICKQLGYSNIYEIKDPHKFRWQTLYEHIRLEEKYKEFISDRSTVDCWTHWVRWSWGATKTYESEKYFRLAFNQALKYSHIIYIPRLIKPSDDGFRWNDEDYQNQVDRLLKETLLQWELMNKTYIVQSNQVKERIQEILQLLN